MPLRYIAYRAPTDSNVGRTVQLIGAIFSCCILSVKFFVMNSNHNACITVIVLLMSLVGFHCDDDNSSNRSKTTALENNLETDTWIVTHFFDTSDETYHFHGYVFTFNDDGTVVAAKDMSAINGTWSVSSSSNGSKLILDFGVTEPFDELNDDWDVIEHASDRVRLQDVNSGSGETDFLTLEKV